MESLRGRNLSHIGCTLGLTLGLIVGMVGAIVVLQATTGGMNGAIAALAVATIGLGALGYYLGGVLTRRLWGNRRSAD
jgi:uncharacterized membrane protein YdjX (TVP38/TMEM64 family)